jgi:hypothetical protein
VAYSVERIRLADVDSPEMNSDSGHARLENFTNNEFDPQDWRSRQSLPTEADPLQESAGKELDKAAKVGWDWLKGQIEKNI